MTDTQMAEAAPPPKIETDPNKRYPVPATAAGHLQCEELGHRWHGGHLHLVLAGVNGIRITK
jgi:hypothetical protein